MHGRGLGLTIMLALVAWPADSGGAPAQKPAATGRLHLTFAERSPLSALDVVLDRMEYTSRSPRTAAGFTYDLTRLAFEVFVPPTYQPDVPHGLFIWMGVADVSPAWLDVLARHKLILVVANTRRGRPALYGPPLDAVHNMKKLYNIDGDRVYAAGFSAGGNVAAMTVRGFPEVFRGGLFLMGGYFYRSYQGVTGPREPTIEGVSPHWKGPLDQIKQQVKLVIMKGGSDREWIPQEGRCDEQALRLDGFTHVSHFEVPGLGHRPPDAAWFEQGIVALDYAAPLTPPLTSPTTEPRPVPSQMAQAQRILATAQYYLDLKVPPVSEERRKQIRQSYQEKARACLQRVQTEYPTTPASVKARALLEEMERTPRHDETGVRSPTE